MRPSRQGGNIVTLKAVFSGGAVGQWVRRRGLYETIKAGREHCNPKGCFRVWAVGQRVRRRGLYETIKAGQK